MGSVNYPKGITPRTIQCTKCGIVQPLAQFVYDKNTTANNTYSDVCCGCRGLEGKMRANLTKVSIAETEVDKLVLRLKTARNADAPHISDALAGLFQRFGGLNGFIEFWYQSLHMQAGDLRYANGLSKQLTAIVKLLSLNDASTGNELEAVKHMSNDELNAFTRKQLQEHVAEDFTYDDPLDDDNHVGVNREPVSADDLKGREAVSDE